MKITIELTLTDTEVKALEYACNGTTGTWSTQRITEYLGFEIRKDIDDARTYYDRSNPTQ